MGSRPAYPGIPGDKEFGITTDDLYSLKEAPGKTLVIGASVVALEIAGSLTSLGYDTTVMVRSVLLRGFDPDISTRIGNYMKENGTKFIHKATPSKLEKTESQVLVTYQQEGDSEKTETFDTVIFAIGRQTDTDCLNLTNARLQPGKNGKLNVSTDQQTIISNIYAVGSVING